MKKYLKSSFMIIISFLILIIFFASCSGGHYHDPEAKANYMVNKISDKLVLNEQQKATLIKIKDEILEKRKSMRTSHQELKKEIIAQIKSDKIDQSKLNDSFKDQQKNHIEMRKFLIKKFADFHKILSPEQRIKLADLVEKFGSKYSKK